MYRVSEYAPAQLCGVCRGPLNEPPSDNGAVVAHLREKQGICGKIHSLFFPEYVCQTHEECSENWRTGEINAGEPFFLCPGNCEIQLPNREALHRSTFSQRAVSLLSRCLDSLPSLEDITNNQPLRSGLVGLSVGNTLSEVHAFTGRAGLAACAD